MWSIGASSCNYNLDCNAFSSISNTYWQAANSGEAGGMWLQTIHWCPYEAEGEGWEGEKQTQPVQTQRGHGYHHWPKNDHYSSIGFIYNGNTDWPQWN